MLTSQWLPAWYLGTFPDNEVMLASYEATLARSWGRKARDVLEEFGPRYFGVRVRSDSAAANRWDLQSHTGGMVTAGLAVYDTMQYIRPPITTICMGMAMSFGAVLLCAGFLCFFL